jgi:hypothetical protein
LNDWKTIECRADEAILRRFLHFNYYKTHILKKLLEPYNVKWYKESLNSSESMPLGGGDVGINVWVEDQDMIGHLIIIGAEQG